MTFNSIHLFQAFSNVISRTVIQQLTISIAHGIKISQIIIVSFIRSLQAGVQPTLDPSAETF